MKAKYGRCAVCAEPITEERFWKAKSHRGEVPDTCSKEHQTLLRVRRHRGLDAKGDKLESVEPRKKSRK